MGARADEVRHIGDGHHQPPALARALDVDRVVEVARVLAVDGDDRQMPEIEAAVHGDGIAAGDDGPGLGQALVAEGHRHLMAEQGDILVFLPAAGLDHELEGVVGVGEAGVLQQFAGQLPIGRLLVEQVVVADDLQAVLFGPGRGLFAGHQCLEGGGADLQHVLALAVLFLLGQELLHHLRGVGMDLVVAELEVDGVAKHGPQQGRDLVVAGLAPETEVGQELGREDQLFLLACHLPDLQQRHRQGEVLPDPADFL